MREYDGRPRPDEERWRRRLQRRRGLHHCGVDILPPPPDLVAAEQQSDRHQQRQQQEETGHRGEHGQTEVLLLLLPAPGVFLAAAAAAVIVMVVFSCDGSRMGWFKWFRFNRSDITLVRDLNYFIFVRNGLHSGGPWHNVDGQLS